MLPHMTTTIIPAVLGVAALASVAAQAAPPDTDINAIAAYAIDGDTFELLRYAFVTDTFTSVGVVQTASGTTIKDCESLSYIGPSPAMGLYSVPTKSSFENRLIRIDPLTAEATVFGPPVVPSSRKVTGMVRYYNAGDGQWYLLAASSEDLTSDPDRSETRELIRPVQHDVNPRAQRVLRALDHQEAVSIGIVIERTDPRIFQKRVGK